MYLLCLHVNDVIFFIVITERMQIVLIGVYWDLMKKSVKLVELIEEKLKKSLRTFGKWVSVQFKLSDNWNYKLWYVFYFQFFINVLWFLKFSAEKATSSQSLMIIRCCGDLVPEETPENRTKLVQEIWKTMENLSMFPLNETCVCVCWFFPFLSS